MKSVAILSLPILANAAVVTNKLRARQFDLTGLANSNVPPIDPFSITKLTPEFIKDSVRERILYGPFKGTHKGGAYLKLDPNSDIFSNRVNGVCTECIVLAVQADIVNKNGSKLDVGSGVYSHHIISADFGRKMIGPPIYSVCPDGRIGGFNFESFAGGKGKPMTGFPGMTTGSHRASNSNHNMKRQIDWAKTIEGIGSIAGSLLSGKTPSTDILQTLAGQFIPTFSFFFAQGDEGTQTKFAVKNGGIKSGFYMGKNNKINLMAEVINYSSVEKDVYLSLDYEYLPNINQLPKDFYDVGIGALNVSPCSTANLHPPNDKAMLYESPPFKVDGEGYIFDVKPHLHDGAINMTFAVNGKAQCTSEAVYGGTDGGLNLDTKENWETITSYTPCPDPIHIKKGDTLTMTALYDVTKHRLRPLSDNHEESAEGMALAIFMFAKPPPS